MKKQLSPIFQFFYSIPSWVTPLVLMLAFLSLLVFPADFSGISFFVLLIITVVVLFGRSAAVNKIKKLRLGLNPLFVTEKFPADLEAQVGYLISAERFEVVNKSSDFAILKRKPQFSVGAAILWSLLGLVPGVIYVVWHFTRPMEVIQLKIASQKPQ